MRSGTSFSHALVFLDELLRVLGTDWLSLALNHTQIQREYTIYCTAGLQLDLYPSYHTMFAHVKITSLFLDKALSWF